MKNQHDKLVSIVIPMFNVEKYINRCLDSILGQTYKNLEIIVVDDRSTDTSAYILDRRAREDGRLKVIHLENNRGVHAARAEGLRVATGDFIGFVDGDDWVAPDMYENLLGEAIKENSDIVICGADKASENEKFLGSKVKFSSNCTYNQEILSKFCLREFGSGVLWNKIYRSELIKKHGSVPLERKLDASEDYIVNVGCFSEAKRVTILPEKYYYYLVRPDSASRVEDNGKNFSRMLMAYVSCLEMHKELSTEQLEYVDVLFSSQMRNIDYQVTSLSLLSPYREDIRNSLERLSKVRPESIYTLVNTFNSGEKPKKVKAIARSLYISGRNVLTKKIS